MPEGSKLSWRGWSHETRPGATQLRCRDHGEPSSHTADCCMTSASGLHDPSHSIDSEVLIMHAVMHPFIMPTKRQHLTTYTYRT